MKTKETSQIIEWYNKLTLEEKFYKVIPYLKSKGINVTERHPDNLTTEEIVKIWEYEYDSMIIESHTELNNLKIKKDNQKEFKEFNEELFKAYIDKFSNEDKLKMLKTLFFKQNKKCPIDLVNDILEYCG